MLFMENNEGIKSASLFFVGRRILYVKRNGRLHQKIAHAESGINNKSIAASVPCDDFTCYAGGVFALSHVDGHSVLKVR